MIFAWIRRALACASALVLLAPVAVGCDDEPKNGNGVNDVRAACDLRSTWKRSGNDCSVCEAAAVTPRCDCPSLAAFSAACIEQSDARKHACAESVDTCVLACKREDCACIEACYANDACKAAAATRDGCITETCAPHCK